MNLSLNDLTNMDAIARELRAVWAEAAGIWLAGGWAMAAIATIAVVMFAMGMHVHFKLRDKGFHAVSEKTWRRWLDHPAESKGAVGELIRTFAAETTLAGAAAVFQRARAAETGPFERDLRVMKICVSAAPLVGLLGTVTGMLATFGALASGSGGDQTMGLVAEGISEALITTETGLVIALPGLFFQHQLARRFERYQAFLAHLENACTQALYRRARGHKALST